MNKEELKEYIKERTDRKEGTNFGSIGFLDAGYKHNGKWYSAIAVYYYYTSYELAFIDIFCLSSGKGLIMDLSGDIKPERIFIFNIDTGNMRLDMSADSGNIISLTDCLLLHGQINNLVLGTLRMKRPDLNRLKELWICGELHTYDGGSFPVDTLRVPPDTWRVYTTNRTEVIDIERIVSEAKNSCEFIFN